MERRGFLGGSDVAPILGISKWKTALDVYNDKLGITKAVQETAPLKWGKILEPVILKEYATQEDCQLISEVVKEDDNYPFIKGHIDAVRADKKAIIEAKSSRQAKQWGEELSDDIPLEYVCQIQLYMHLMDIQNCDIAVLLNGSDFRIFKVKGDKTLQAKIVDRLVNFWNNHVKTHIPPEPMNLKDLKQLFPLSIKGVCEASKDVYDDYIALKDIKENIKKLEQSEEELVFRLQKVMGVKDTLSFSGVKLASWKTSKTKPMFDLTRFKQENTKLYEQYIKEANPIRRFLVKG